jgi:hypothetical protein
LVDGEFNEVRELSAAQLAQLGCEADEVRFVNTRGLQAQGAHHGNRIGSDGQQLTKSSNVG